MKQSGSYASLLRGVSQQAPEQRQAGQHDEQVNMLSDPVRGLIRRQGSVFKQYRPLTPGNPAQAAAMMDEFNGYRSISHTAGGKEYVILIKEFGRNGYTPGNYTGYAPAVVVYNITDNVFCDMSGDTETYLTETLVGQRGISAMVSIGRILAFACKYTPVTASSTQLWGIPGASFVIVWIRGGAYNRTYRITTQDERSASCTTLDPAQPGAAAGIAPENIAQVLVNQLALRSIGAYRVGSYILLDTKQEITVTDGGDNSLIRGVYQTADDVGKLPILAVPGQIIKIVTGAASQFYVQANAKTTDSTHALQEVTWVECAGTRQGDNVQNLMVATFEGSTFRMARSPAALATAAPVTFVPSLAGDVNNNPAPFFLRGTQITYMGMFQDRLLIAAGAALAVSAAGDYFNFMRSTVTTVPVKDGFEMIAQGGEDDFLRHSVPYSKNLVLFGDKRQYVISGASALTPTSANMAVMTSYADCAKVAPVAAGGQIYYARDRSGYVGVQQIQPGSYVDSAESFPASAQISEYIPAAASQIIAVTGMPNLLLLRSRSAYRQIYSFSYVDQPDGRKQEAWSRWEFGVPCGTLMGMHPTENGVLLFWMRYRTDQATMSLVCDILDTSARVPSHPYLDSALVAAGVDRPDRLLRDTNFVTACDRNTDYYLVGTNSSQSAKLPAVTQWQGVPFDSYVTLTRPIRQDQKGVAISDGRLVVTKLDVTTKTSGGLTTIIDTANGRKTQVHTARVVGGAANLIGRVPVTNGAYSVPVGKEARDYTLTIKAIDWYPLALTTIEWVGQSFNRTPRA